MSLLTEEKRKAYFEKLGLGEYNTKNIKKLQKKYLRKKDVDGIYGPDTDNLLRHVYNCSLVKNFEPEEFKCECGGRHCTGYPSYMKQVELKNLQKIRDHYDKPMKVTCGLRCRGYNAECRGSIQNSLHLVGRACDFYMAGVTDTLANRKKSIKWMKKLDNTHYIYGNGINSYGYYVSAPYMGNAMHYDTNKVVKVPVSDPFLDKLFDACKAQAEWMQNYRYHWRKFPTIANSKDEGTCVSFVACVLQRLGILKKGQYIWHDGHGKVTHANNKMKVIYPGMRSLKSCKGILKAGDIVIAGNKSDVGAGSHIFVLTGKWEDGDPYIYDNHSAERVKKNKGAAHKYDGDKKVIAVIRLKQVR